MDNSEFSQGLGIIRQKRYSKTSEVLGGRGPRSRAGSGKRGPLVRITDIAVSWLRVTSQLCQLCYETLAKYLVFLWLICKIRIMIVPTACSHYGIK